MSVSSDTPHAAGASPDALQDALLAYLAAHPDACDTADGILEWWLQGSQVWSLAEVEHALQNLVRAGTLKRLPALDGRVRYRRAAGQS
jgi:Fe2+ or Zn2+ uptake regulation protein